jgi:hypothetical protein
MEVKISLFISLFHRCSSFRNSFLFFGPFLVVLSRAMFPASFTPLRRSLSLLARGVPLISYRFYSSDSNDLDLLKATKDKSLLVETLRTFHQKNGGRLEGIPFVFSNELESVIDGSKEVPYTITIFKTSSVLRSRSLFLLHLSSDCR